MSPTNPLRQFETCPSDISNVDPAGNALLDSDRTYFEFAANIEHIDQSQLSWMPGAANTPAGCTCQRIGPELAHSDPGRLQAWLNQIETRFWELGNPSVRIYLHEHSPLSEFLQASNYSVREEIGFGLFERAGPADNLLQVVEVDSDDLWEQKLQLHSRSPQFPDDHDYDPRVWTQLERSKCQTGELKCYLIQTGEAVRGAIGMMEIDGLIRLKNLVLASEHRRIGIAAATITKIAAMKLGSQDNRWIGAFGIEGGRGEKLYRSLGMATVCRQFEWTKELS